MRLGRYAELANKYKLPAVRHPVAFFVSFRQGCMK
jgi:hypothetical protein